MTKIRAAHDVEANQPLLSGPLVHEGDDESHLPRVRSGADYTRVPSAAWFFRCRARGIPIPGIRVVIRIVTHRRAVECSFCLLLTLMLLSFTFSSIFRPSAYDLQLRTKETYVGALKGFVRDVIAFQPPAGTVTQETQQLQQQQVEDWRKTLFAHLDVLQAKDERNTLQSSSSLLNSTTQLASKMPTTIPATLFSSDKTQYMDERRRTEWHDYGFTPVEFFNEDRADCWIRETFPAGPRNDTVFSTLTSTKNGNVVDADGGKSTRPSPDSPTQESRIQLAWSRLPRSVMRADFLRYALLLAGGGGTWADVDVQPLMNRSFWTGPWDSDSGGEGDGDLEWEVEKQERVGSGRKAVNVVVGIECDPISYMRHSIRAWLERVWLMPVRFLRHPFSLPPLLLDKACADTMWYNGVGQMKRHREVQFVQWTLHSKGGHPIFADVMRRMIDADGEFMRLQRRQQQQQEQYILSSWWPWTWSWTHRHLNRKQKQPWSSIRMEWIWNGTLLPRLGWNRLSVEEWTGPATFTDAVFA